jgi:hypothetical protein
VIDLHLWITGLLAVPIATVVAMFSLAEVPPPLQPALPPDAFDGAAAATLAGELAASTPEPRPGSDADDALAELVSARFASIQGATVAEQRFEGSFEGERVDLRNLILILPGRSDRQIALIAGRDAAAGSGAATSLASTAALLEAASGFSGSSHEKTLVFVSTDGDSAGALGTRKFIEDYSDADLLDAAIVLSQPAAADPSPPLVIPWSTGPESTASQLAETADDTISQETGRPAGDERPLDDLFRLAIPAALGAQGPLIQAGLDAVRISSSGELPPSAEQDQAEDVNPESLGNFGRGALSLILALDAAPGEPEHGPSAYIGLAGNLLPGWTITMLALALLAPVGVSAGVALAAAARSPGEALRGMLWTGVRVLPFLAALLVVSMAALVGLLPSPAFPFDPALERLGLAGTISVVAAIGAYAALAFVLRPLAPPPPTAAATAGSAALLVAALAALWVVAINPYLGLLVALGLQLWLLAAARVLPGRLAAAGLVLGGLAPVLGALIDLAGRFGSGLGVWRDLLLMFTGGQIGLTLVVLGCLLAGAAIAIVAVAGPGPAPHAPELRIRRRRRRTGEKAAASDGGEVPADAAPPASPPEPEPAEESPGPDAQPEAPAEPERDPRLWSKPRGSSCSPPGSRSVTPPPSVT